MALGGSLAGLAEHLVPARALEAREKRGRLATGNTRLDELLDGGWVRGALNELVGDRGQGRTAIVGASLAATLRRGEAAALVDFGGSFDPWSAGRIGIPLERLLWVRAPQTEAFGLAPAAPIPPAAIPPLRASTPGGKVQQRLLAAAEAVVLAGGFALVVLDFNERTPAVPTAAWLRLRRVAGGTAVLVVSRRPSQGLLGVVSVRLEGARVRFWDADTRTARLLCGIETRAASIRHPAEDASDGAAGLRLWRDPAARAQEMTNDVPALHAHRSTDDDLPARPGER